MEWVDILLLLIVGSMVFGLWRVIHFTTTIGKKGRSQIAASPVKPAYNDRQLAMVHIQRDFKPHTPDSFSVFIDGEKVGTVGNGKEVLFKIDAGRHTLLLKDLSLWANLSEPVVFEIQPGETVTFECVAKFTLLFPYAYLKQTNNIKEPQSEIQIEKNKSDIVIKLLSQYEKRRVASEEVEVPRGVIVRIKRSRSIEHAIEIGQQTSEGIRIDAGILKIISASVHGEIQKRQTRTSREIETMEYEIELNGNISNRYELIWMDVWQKGVAEIKSRKTQEVSFQIKERTELQVVPVTHL